MFAGKTAINKTSNPKAPYLRVFLGTNKTPKTISNSPDV
tara:strand:+ start:116 stop:232 length:117 start_codon:yes stop_codon:yes gene_type:complete